MNASRPLVFNGKAVGNDNLDVSVKVKRADGYKDHSTARFHISVGKENHEHPKFKATMAWAMDNFDRIIICVNDTLQRHNFLFEGETPQSAYEHARRAGDEWVKRNINFGMQQSSRFEVKRWSDWITREEFAVKRDEVLQAIRDNAWMEEAIEKEIESFWKRAKKRGSISGDFDFAKFQIHSREYLLEECAAFSIMFDEDVAADVYPGSSLLPCTLFKPAEQKSAGTNYGFTRIEFKDEQSSKSVVNSLGRHIGDHLVNRGQHGSVAATIAPTVKVAGG